MAKKTLMGTLFPNKAQAQNELERAHHAAQRVVESAVEKSEQIVEHTKFIDARLKAELELELKKTVAETAEIIKLETQKALVTILEGFSQELQIQLKQSQKELSDKVVAAFDKARKEIEQYKQTKRESIDVQLEQKVSTLAKDVLQKTLTGSDHHKLVIEALEKAKGDGLFE